MQTFPPAIEYISRIYHAVISIERANADAMNGYGRSERWSMCVSLVLDVCEKCGESLFHEGHPLDGDRHRHRWKTLKEPVVLAVNADPVKAMAEAEDKAVEFLRDKVLTHRELGQPRRRALGEFLAAYEESPWAP